MRQLSLFFALLMAALAQQTLPATPWTGWAPAPFMLGVVIYYALMRERRVSVEAALLAGLMEDGLSLAPLGMTSFAYAAAALVIDWARGDVVARQWTTHAALGAAANLWATAFAAVVLYSGALISPGPLFLLLRAGGAVVMGALAAPLACWAMEGLEETLGLLERESEEA